MSNGSEKPGSLPSWLKRSSSCSRGTGTSPRLRSSFLPSSQMRRAAATNPKVDTERNGRSPGGASRKIKVIGLNVAELR